MTYKLLIINPGSTSTKLAIYENENKVVQENIEHDAAELGKYDQIPDQIPFRMKIIQEFMKKNGVKMEELSAIVDVEAWFQDSMPADIR